MEEEKKMIRVNTQIIIPGLTISDDHNDRKSNRDHKLNHRGCSLKTQNY